MNWVWGLLGAVAGATFGGGGPPLVGMALGAAVGIGWGRLLELGARVDRLERELAERTERPAARAAATAAPPAGPATSAAPPRAATAPAAAAAAAPAAATRTDAGWAPAAPRATMSTDSAPATPANAGPPAWLDRLIGAVRDYFTGGNTLVRVGVIVLFFGVAFLLRYVAERTTLPMEYRLMAVALGAIVMLVLGWRLRRRRPGYALAMQGGAVGILYLTVFVALRLYSLLPAAAAFLLLVGITAFAVLLAVLQDSLTFAMLATAGGFAAPVLASSGQGSHVTLFSYYAVLNAGLVAIAWFKAWRPLTVLGFLSTFIIGTAWGVLRYHSELFASTEPFLALFFAMYLAIAVLFALRQPPDLKGYVDGTIVFGVPVAGFALQSALLHDDRFGLALSALCVGATYVLLATLLWRRHLATLRLLVESFLALGVAFLTLAVPLAIDGHWTAATWALEGAALLWVGCRQGRLLPRASGALLQVAGGMLFSLRSGAALDALPLLNSGFIGGVLVALAAVYSTLTLRRHREALHAYETPLAPLLFAWGSGWWLYAGLSEIERCLPTRYEPAAAVAFCALTALLALQLLARAGLAMARWAALALLPALYIAALLWGTVHSHPFAAYGWLAWPLAFAAMAAVLRRCADEPEVALPEGVLSASTHTATVWLAVALLTAELVWGVGRTDAYGTGWTALAWMLPAAAALFALPAAIARIAWPCVRHATAYLAWTGAGLGTWLIGWLLYNNALCDGEALPLPYVPLVNPLDLGSAAVVLALLHYWRSLRAGAFALGARSDPRQVYGAIAALAFAWLNGAVLRAVHHLAGVPFQLEWLLRSPLVQVTLSIFWAVLALGGMLFATRRGNRIVWLVGAGLLGVVVAKLFLVDLSRVDSVARIVSFVVVGILMLVIGYFSPLPPQRADSQDAAANADAGDTTPRAPA
ncbi:MAG: DUF2339 domain-containing protein [Steroidobacteraceae bacterium]